MKKIFALMLAAAMLLCAVSAAADVKIGQVDFAAHGNKCFAVLTAVVDGETIVAAHIDEFQVLAGDGVIGVPNSDAIFADLYAEGKVLASKRVNNGFYSTSMVSHAGATRPLGANYGTIEAFVTGKTITELDEILNGKTKEDMVDTVAGCTLADTFGYTAGLLEAAKAALNTTGYYTLYNKTGEAITEITLTDNTTGEQLIAAGMQADAVQVVTFTGKADTSITLAFTTESGYHAEFATLHIEETPLTLLAADAMTGATPLTFFVPAE